MMILLNFMIALLLVSAEPPEMAPESLFDFWVGEWDLHWKDAEGNPQKGHNRIVKILDGQVIQENFEAFSLSEEAPSFKGMSLSVYNPQTEKWHQAWADNQGGYYNFVGKFESDRRMFVTTTTNQEGLEIQLRMVFREITTDAFVWDWESSKDEGHTWQRNWQIHYQRHKGS
ncbi:MAG: hypothetical protein RIG62_04080 [Cyclobacteriaceae bacterium]